MPENLRAALAEKTRDVPVDVDPAFAFKMGVK
jgi:hypothetical protein